MVSRLQCRTSVGVSRVKAYERRVRVLSTVEASVIMVAKGLPVISTVTPSWLMPACIRRASFSCCSPPSVQ